MSITIESPCNSNQLCNCLAADFMTRHYLPPITDTKLQLMTNRYFIKPDANINLKTLISVQMFV